MSDHRPIWLDNAPREIEEGRLQKRFQFAAFWLKERNIKEEVDMAWSGPETGDVVCQF